MIKRILLLIAMGIGAGGAAFAQSPITQTTLASAITQGPSGASSGLTGSYTTQINLTSATGVQQAINGQPITFAYIDQELFGIMTLQPGQTTVYTVLRGQQGTRVAAHSIGAMVLIQVVTPQYGGYTGSGGFQASDPPGGNGATCIAANTLAYPWVNILTGAEWLCSAQTGTWTPSFNNPLLYVEAAPNGATVASVAGSTAVPSSFFSVSGTNAITAWTLPVGCAGQTPVATSTTGACVFGVYPTGAFTTTATGNIANATTAVVGKVMWWTYNPVTQKFGSSY